MCNKEPKIVSITPLWGIDGDPYDKTFSGTRSQVCRDYFPMKRPKDLDKQGYSIKVDDETLNLLERRGWTELDWESTHINGDGTVWVPYARTELEARNKFREDFSRELAESEEEELDA